MNCIFQQKSLLIGDLQEINTLENKNTARLLIVSDSHGSLSTLEEIVRQFGHDCDAFIFCGDGLHDIIALMENALSDEKLLDCLPPVFACVRGNGDIEQYRIQKNDTLEPTFLPIHFQDRLIFKAGSRTVMIVHGHNHGVDAGIEMLCEVGKTYDADIIFYGHTHRPLREELHGTLIINAGSISHPRGGFPPSFAIVSYPAVLERFHVDFYEIKEKLRGGREFSVMK
ncbi:MAG: YfcE family phosphodiesterase [Treponemataceae bacterium]